MTYEFAFTLLFMLGGTLVLIGKSIEHKYGEDRIGALPVGYFMLFGSVIVLIFSIFD